jgi:hypothetical protein
VITSMRDEDMRLSLRFPIYQSRKARQRWRIS